MKSFVSILIGIQVFHISVFAMDSSAMYAWLSYRTIQRSLIPSREIQQLQREIAHSKKELQRITTELESTSSFSEAEFAMWAHWCSNSNVRTLHELRARAENLQTTLVLKENKLADLLQKKRT